MWCSRNLRSHLPNHHLLNPPLAFPVCVIRPAQRCDLWRSFAFITHLNFTVVSLANIRIWTCVQAAWIFIVILFIAFGPSFLSLISLLLPVICTLYCGLSLFLFLLCCLNAVRFMFFFLFYMQFLRKTTQAFKLSWILRWKKKYKSC